MQAKKNDGKKSGEESERRRESIVSAVNDQVRERSENETKGRERVRTRETRRGRERVREERGIERANEKVCK
jgi:hypothetical protein